MGENGYSHSLNSAIVLEAWTNKVVDEDFSAEGAKEQGAKTTDSTGGSRKITLVNAVS